MPVKKDFKANNPALNFISAPVQNAQGIEAERNIEDTYNELNTDNTHNTSNTYVYNTQNTSKIYNTDKTYYAQSTQSTDNTFDTGHAYTHTENKSKRLNLLIRPSLHRQAQKIAHMQRSSVNDIINMALSQYIVEHREEIARYDKLYNE